MVLSTRVKEAIKTALAMVIAYGVALAMDWDRAYWAAFAVSACSLGSVGASVNQAAMRMLGTLLGVIVALLIIALAPQQRLLFIVMLAVWLGICAYRMAGSKKGYFWFCAGFVCVIITIDGGANSENAFDTAILRLQETGLGVLAYGLVMSLLWPQSDYDKFNIELRRLAAVRLELYQAYLRLMRDPGAELDASELRAQGIQLQGQVDQLLDGAITDSYEAWELRHQWRKFRREAGQLAETMERWRHTFAEIRTLDLTTLFPNLTAFGDELETRFEEATRMLNDHAPDRLPGRIDLDLDEAALAGLPHFQRAALITAQTRLRRLEALSHETFLTIQDIKGFDHADPATASPEPAAPRLRLVIDRDCAAAGFRAALGIVLAYIIWIYVTVPGGAGIMVVAGVQGLAMSPIPHVPVNIMYAPFAVALSFASIVYIFILPQLSTFQELAVVIFVVTFVICYLFHTPRQGVARMIGLAMFVLILGIDNQQTYSFLSAANSSFMYVIGLPLLWLVSKITTSPRPETGFIRLLDRFFVSSRYLATTRWAPGEALSGREKRRRAYHSREIANVPSRLGPWSVGLDPMLYDGDPKKVQAIIGNLQVLAHRMQELLEARELPQSALLVRELQADMIEWRDRLELFFEDYAGGKAEELQKLLSLRLRHLEQRVEETINMATPGAISEGENENFYRLLGAFRSVSEAAIEFGQAVSVMDRAHWREARF